MRIINTKFRNYAGGFIIGSVVVGFIVLLIIHLGNDLKYIFPSRMRKISDKEFLAITGKEYALTAFKSSAPELKPPNDSIFSFNRSGAILDGIDDIGTWSRDRNVFLDSYDKRFFISRITPECNGITLETRYMQGDTIQKTIRVQLVDREYLKKVKLDKRNQKETEPRDDEFQFYH